MKTKIFLAFSLFMLVTLVFGQDGVYMEHKNKVSGITGMPDNDTISKSWFTDNKMRVENDEQTIIFRLDKKKVWILMSANKKYMEMSLEQMEQMAKMGAAMGQKEEDLDFKFKKTGAKKKIKNWDCYEVTTKSPMMTQKIWLTEDLPFDKNDFYKLFKNMPQFKKHAESFFNSKEIKGFPVFDETEMDKMGMKIKSIRELITIRKEKMSAGLFELPKDYEKMEQPMNQMQR
jgi:hypothetical protein